MNILEHNTIDSKSILRKCRSRSANRPSHSLCRNLAESLASLVIQKAFAYSTVLHGSRKSDSGGVIMLGFLLYFRTSH